MSEGLHIDRRSRTHRAARRHRPRAVVVRVVLSLGLLVGFGAIGTSAYWTDRAVVDGGQLSSGSMDLQLQTPTNADWRHVGLGADGTGTATTDTALAIPNLTPSESVAFGLGARNVGNPRLTYSATVATSGTWTFVGSPIRARFYAGTVQSNTTTYPRTGTCNGPALGSADVIVTGTATTIIPDRSLTGAVMPSAGQSESLCLVVSMISTATNDNQSKTGALRLTFTGTQAAS